MVSNKYCYRKSLDIWKIKAKLARFEDIQEAWDRINYELIEKVMSRWSFPEAMIDWT